MSLPRIVIADDHTVFADALGHLLRESYLVVATVADGRALLDRAEQLKPDLVVLDIGMPLLNGIEAARQLKQVVPKPKIVFLSMHGDVSYVAQALRVGASGYVLKTSPADEIVRALRRVLAGGIHLDSKLPPALQDLVPRRKTRLQAKYPVELTVREREVLQLVAEGHSAKEIAYVLHLSPKTIEYHKYNLMRKTLLHSTAGLTRLAIRLGISDSEPPAEKQGNFLVNLQQDQS